MSSHGFQTHTATRPGSSSSPVVIAAGPSVGSGVSDSRPSPRTGLIFVSLVALLALGWFGMSLIGSTSTMVACAAILLFGLPHGALDLEIIKRERGTGWLGMGALLLLYLGLASAMAAVWHLAPVAALAIFLIVAVVHFAEDWQELRSPFLAQGMAIALLTAPTFLHLAELERLFAALSGRSDAAIVANFMMLLAPVSMAVAGVSLWTSWQAGFGNQAIAGALLLVGMVMLPPVIGFALFFCLYHSPRHLEAAFFRAGSSQTSLWIVPVVTLAALGIAVVLFAGEVRADLPAQLVAASFMTLSVLTVPHMIVPAVVDALASRRSEAHD